MPKESQHRILLLLKILYEQTDENHPMSVSEILCFWKEQGINASRKSVYSDISLLEHAGVDIICIKSTQNRYFIGSRLFELPELKVLVDAVESSHFITSKKSRNLIPKLGQLTNSAQAASPVVRSFTSVKGLKRFSCCSAGIPVPVSVTMNWCVCAPRFLNSRLIRP